MIISIIITSWNTRALLSECLQSIFQHPPSASWEVIVVDNASQDGSADMVERDFPAARLIRNSRNVGFAPANNAGAAIAEGQFLLLLGSDTRVDSGSIDILLKLMTSRKEVGAVAARLISPLGTIQRSCKRFPHLGNALAMYLSLHWLNRRYLMMEFDHESEAEVDQVDATCLMIRKEIINSTGLFDPRYVILYNDVDLCYRIRHSGWKILYTPGAVVIHHGSQSTKQVSSELRLRMYRDILLYYSEHFGMTARILLTPLLMFRFFIKTRTGSAVHLIRRNHDDR